MALLIRQVLQDGTEVGSYVGAPQNVYLLLLWLAFPAATQFAGSHQRDGLGWSHSLVGRQVFEFQASESFEPAVAVGQDAAHQLNGRLAAAAAPNENGQQLGICQRSGASRYEFLTWPVLFGPLVDIHFPSAVSGLLIECLAEGLQFLVAAADAA